MRFSLALTAVLAVAGLPFEQQAGVLHVVVTHDDGTEAAAPVARDVVLRLTDVNAEAVDRPAASAGPPAGVLREGVHVLDAGAIGPACGTVRLALYSEKAPAKADTVTVAPSLLDALGRELEAPTPARPGGPAARR